MVTSLIDTPLQMPTITVKPTDRQAAADQPAAEKPRRGLFGPEGFSFSAFLDIINPLQHIPVVGTIYRAVTGDTIENGSRMLGGALFGGPIGFIVSAINGMIEESTGKDVGDHVLAMAGIDFGGQKATSPAKTGLAEANPAQNAPTNTNAQNAPQSQNGSSLEAILASGRGGLDDIVWNAPRFVASEKQMLAEAAQQPLSQNAQQTELLRAREIPIGALSDLAQRAWANPVASNHNPAATSPIRATRLDLPQANATPAPVTPAPATPALATPAPAAAQVQASAQASSQAAEPAASNDGRQWFPAFPQQGGVAVRSVGAQPVGPQNAATKSGTARGVTYSQAGTQAGVTQDAANNGQADLAERANAAYQKYLDMKERQSRERALDKSF
ncbi:hypothetical protein [Ferrovibrio sp.]|uniref:hypothetical protein n=1 Tax=Ferrovibrio sp. TaxID=1917215 RepID=UPI0035B49A3F